MFEKQRFVQDCIAAMREGQGAVRELVAAAVAQGEALVSGLGEPNHAGIETLHRSKELTILNFVWAPYMSVMPHNHLMWAVIGIYSGREDNMFWKRAENTINPVSARSLGIRDVAALGPDTIHSVLNPLGKMTCAIHVYGGDFFSPPTPRSEWDHETLLEQPLNLDRVKARFHEAENRFRAGQELAPSA